MTFFGKTWTFRELTASPYGLAIVGAAFGGYYVWTEHQAHFVDALPYLLISGCILMHFFMHRGHGHSHGNDEQNNRDKHPNQDDR